MSREPVPAGVQHRCREDPQIAMLLQGLTADELRGTLMTTPADRPTCAACQVYRTRAELAERQAAEAVDQAYRYRLLWEAAASCLRHNRARLAKPRGGDEARVIAHAGETDLGLFWSGRTDGWLA